MNIIKKYIYLFIITISMIKTVSIVFINISIHKIINNFKFVFNKIKNKFKNKFKKDKMV